MEPSDIFGFSPRQMLDRVGTVQISWPKKWAKIRSIKELHPQLFESLQQPGWTYWNWHNPSDEFPAPWIFTPTP